jgi:voltage-gated potassium channel
VRFPPLASTRPVTPDQRHPSDVRVRLVRVVVAAATVVAIGTVGYVALGFGPLDALYQTVTTVTTVGFREIEPLDATGQVFTILLIIGGVGTVLYAFTVILGVVIEGTLGELLGRRRMDRELAQLSGHVIVCGSGRVGVALARYLGGERRVVLVDVDPRRVEREEGLCVVGDATDDDVLRQAGLERASALVAALTSDADNVFVTLSARAARPDLFIVARARDSSSVAKLERAGADRVVNPQDLGGARMAAFIARPHVTEFVDVVMHDRNLELQLDEITVPGGSPEESKALGDTGWSRPGGALILAVRDGAAGRFISNPSLDTRLGPGTVLIAMGTEEQLKELADAVGSPLGAPLPRSEVGRDPGDRARPAEQSAHPTDPLDPSAHGGSNRDGP